MNYLRYILGLLISIPFLPILYLQGKRVDKEVPRLPEAEDPRGTVGESTYPPMKLLALGESTFAGVGVSRHEEGFAGALARNLASLYERKVEWEVIAQSGYTARQVREVLLPQSQQAQPDLIVLGIGANDAFKLNTPWGWEKEVVELIRDIKIIHPNIPIVFASLPPIKHFPAFTPLMQFFIGGLVEILGDCLPAIASAYPDIYYHNTRFQPEDWTAYQHEDEDVNQFFSDGVHPSKLAYEIWGKELAFFISTQIGKVISL
ncbi:MAG: SGNH/GDSL hydrolase family protein [Bacteroidota bacterium]